MLCPPVVSFVYHFYFFAGVVIWEESVLTDGEALFEGLNNPGGGKNTHSVLEGLGLHSMCISSYNLSKLLNIRSRTF